MTTFRFAIGLAACLILSAVPAMADTKKAAYCTRTAPPGQPIDGHFMGVPYEMMSQGLAEKFCGAPAKPLVERLLRFVTESGCGPETEIYKDIRDSALQVEKAGLRELVSGGDVTVKLSDAQVQSSAENMTNQLGGCAKLIEWHRTLD